jgi:hypothetical protein
VRLRGGMTKEILESVRHIQETTIKAIFGEDVWRILRYVKDRRCTFRDQEALRE